jgi:hypothetical protein
MSWRPRSSARWRREVPGSPVTTLWMYPHWRLRICSTSCTKRSTRPQSSSEASCGCPGCAART